MSILCTQNSYAELVWAVYYVRFCLLWLPVVCLWEQEVLFGSPVTFLALQLILVLLCYVMIFHDMCPEVAVLTGPLLVHHHLVPQGRLLWVWDSETLVCHCLCFWVPVDRLSPCGYATHHCSRNKICRILSNLQHLSPSVNFEETVTLMERKKEKKVIAHFCMGVGGGGGGG